MSLTHPAHPGGEASEAHASSPSRRRPATPACPDAPRGGGLRSRLSLPVAAALGGCAAALPLLPCAGKGGIPRPPSCSACGASARVHPFSRCRVTARDGVVDRMTGVQGVILQVARLVWVHAAAVDAVGGYYCTHRHAAGFRYRVAHKRGLWAVDGRPPPLAGVTPGGLDGRRVATRG